MARFSLGGRKKKPASGSPETPTPDLGAGSEPLGDTTVFPAPPDEGSSRRRPKVVSALDGFKDPSRRPRYIIWTGAGVVVLAAVMIVALGVTSSYWFCANVCHKVQDDSIIAYNRSSHSEISCMACHEPVNANPLVFILAKAESLGELYLTALNKYELPLNPESTSSFRSAYWPTEDPSIASRRNVRI